MYPIFILNSIDLLNLNINDIVKVWKYKNYLNIYMKSKCPNKFSNKDLKKFLVVSFKFSLLEMGGANLAEHSGYFK